MNNTAVLGVLFALAAGLASVAGAFIVSRRQRSGRIDTSEASVLWVESQAMRRELRDEVTGLRHEVTGLRETLEQRDAQLAERDARIQDLLQQIREAVERHPGIGQ